MFGQLSELRHSVQKYAAAGPSSSSSIAFRILEQDGMIASGGIKIDNV